MRVPYYVIFDPQHLILPDVLTVYRLDGLRYQVQEKAWFPELNLGLILWEGEYEGRKDLWLRWSNESGTLIPTGK